MGWNDHLDDPDDYERFVDSQFAKADADRKRERENAPLPRARTAPVIRSDVDVWHCPLCHAGRPCDRHAR